MENAAPLLCLSIGGKIEEVWAGDVAMVVGGMKSEQLDSLKPVKVCHWLLWKFNRNFDHSDGIYLHS